MNNLGWKYKIGLKEGLIKTYEWYIRNKTWLTLYAGVKIEPVN
jgi:dTDP-D-glucose 4,6-dehydratase